MMQAWADYLDRLRAGEEIEATHGTGAFRNTNVAGDPGTPTHGPPFPVAGAVPPTVGPCPQLPARVLRGSADTPARRSANWVIRRLAAALKTLPGGIIGPGATRRGGWQVRAHVHPPRCRTRHRKRGVAPVTAASAGAASPLRRPWCNRKAASDIRNRWRAHRNGGSVHMHLDVDVHARYATDPR